MTEQSEALVERLRAQRPNGEHISVARLMDEAADTIEALQAREAAIKAATSYHAQRHADLFNELAAIKADGERLADLVEQAAECIIDDVWQNEARQALASYREKK